jgi:small-conductance mechanosensitive channel
MLEIPGQVLKALYMPVVAFAPKLVAGLFVFAMFYIANWIIGFILKRLKKKFTGRAAVFNLIRITAKIIILLVGLISALGTMGINVSALVAGLGLTGFALGYALKDSISNLIAGVLIIMYKPFKVGDHIVISGNDGTVKMITLRYIKIQGDGQIFLVPNGTAFTQIITIKEDLPDKA